MYSEAQRAQATNHSATTPVAEIFLSNVNDSKYVEQKDNRPTIQPKLTIGSPGDPYEHEADSFANRVMRKSESRFSIQRKCATCKHEEQRIQRKPFNIKPYVQKSEIHGGGMTSEAISSQIESSKGGGNPMSENSRSFMESRFGNDFSNVKIHTDSNAIQLSQNLNAQAFTVGNDVFFNKGRYNPESDSGKHLLAHELTHVVQQGGYLMRKVSTDSPLVDECMERKEGDILPGNVGLVEQINREVRLSEILGADRESFEHDIRKDKKVLWFVCNYGLTAVAALYYNRDYKNRLDRKKAMLALLNNEEYYSPRGFDEAQDTRKALARQFSITIERGDKEWSPHDIVRLKTALDQLSKPEAHLIEGYHFIRSTYESSEGAWGLELLGLHSSVASGKRTITMYDGYEHKKPENGFENALMPGSNTILHEIGHAIHLGRLTESTKRYYSLKKKYDMLKWLFKYFSIYREKKNVDLLRTFELARDGAERVMARELEKVSLVEFFKLIKGRKPLTEYSTIDHHEAFAEAFMLFKVDPHGLEKRNKALFKWFARGGFI